MRPWGKRESRPYYYSTSEERTRKSEQLALKLVQEFDRIIDEDDKRDSINLHGRIGRAT